MFWNLYQYLMKFYLFSQLVGQLLVNYAVARSTLYRHDFSYGLFNLQINQYDNFIFFLLCFKYLPMKEYIVLTLCLIQTDILLKPVQDISEGLQLIRIFQKYIYFPKPNTIPIYITSSSSKHNSDHNQPKNDISEEFNRMYKVFPNLLSQLIFPNNTLKKSFINFCLL